MLFIFLLNGEEGRRDGEGQARAESLLTIHSCADRLQNLKQALMEQGDKNQWVSFLNIGEFLPDPRFVFAKKMPVNCSLKSLTFRKMTVEQLGSLAFSPSLLLISTHSVAPAQEGSLRSQIPALMLFVSWNLGWLIFIGGYCYSLLPDSISLSTYF